MTRHLASLTLAALLAISFVGAARADDDPPDLPTRVESYSTSFIVNADASFVEERSGAYRVLKESAVEDAKRYSISYSTSIQTAEMLEAYTRKPDGTRVEVSKDSYQVNASSGRGKDAPVFSDRTTMTWVFPDVAVGDTLVFAYRLVGKEPMFEGHFSINETINRFMAYDSVRVRIDSPASLWAQFEARQMKEVRNEVVDGRRLLEWTYENPNPVRNKREDWTVYDPDKEPGYSFSTFRDYAAIAEAYGRVSRAKGKPTERVRKLADEIVGGRSEPREVARALYDWTARTINYAGNCIGLGAVVPRDVDFVLDHRIGDCKDHATLLQALLAAKGIESTQVLVNAGSTYTLPRIPVVSTVNHVLNYIPSLDLYVDSTSSTTPFGMLPHVDTWKPVLHVDGYRHGTRTPFPPIDQNQQRYVSDITIAADGSVEVDVDVELEGDFALGMRSYARDLPEDTKRDLAKEFLKGIGKAGEGRIELDEAKELDDSYHYDAHLKIEEMIPTGSAAFVIAPMLFNPQPISSYAAAAGMEVAQQDVSCLAGHTSEKLVYHLPEEMQVLSIPDPMKAENDFLSYEARYELKGRTLEVERTFHDRTPGRICSPELMQRYKKFAKPVLENLKAQVLYKLPARTEEEE